ncbi:phytanoyl-CoA dioxygenase family protein [Hydrogenophaga sp. YM1]|jgi:hypothetical protein|uniref:phytanoyl-CoA dioxygenase family protein n=1 Tax=Hydrogenophaga sp. YM1 TaxID=2806262 RepID=UPI00195780CE|nr:phytanoyl-CoA dioxygenase family protein [Hydrogenophaga sp. YM1]QRR35386.1 phytanoyl-CoA dioxygenase family protein [Hydrogenophaga sp. YM1]
MTPDQVHSFNDRGIVRLDGFHARGVAPVRQRVLDELRRLTGGKGLPRAVQGLPVFQQIGKLSSLVKVPGAHGALVTPALMACIGQLSGRAAPVPQPLQLLLSPPQQGAWRLDGLNWHVDVVADPPGRLPGIQAFFLIDDVAPHGGATLALAGSHRAAAQRGADGVSLREALRSTADRAARLQALGVDVVEMSGRAGDVYLMDMRLLHTPSINATRQMRLMATTRCLFGP